jgi:ribonuclease R/exosome complex exonuclease DIS3/RRP44
MSKKKKSKLSDFEKRYKLELIQYLTNNPDKSYNYKQLAYQLNIVDDFNKGELVKLLNKLKQKKQIKETGRGKFKIAHQSHYYTGRVDLALDGRGFFICEELEEDIVIPHRNLNHAFHGDEVRVYVYNRKRSSKKREGDVVEILKRYKTHFVGTLQLYKNFGFVIPDDKRVYADFFIPIKHINGAKDGDKVGVEFRDWPANSENPFGKITHILGRPGEHNTEIHSILFDYGLPADFPKEVEDAAAKIPVEIHPKEIASRKDLREVLTFTIDPADAKDFDDALSFKKLPGGTYEIGIHIADVSHYVTPGSILDEEAYNRGTSVYLVDRVVPMLPEILSNNLCSLRPKEDKLTFSAVFEINNSAQVLRQWFGRTVIHSDKRYTYEEAQEIIEGKSTINDSPLHEAILTLDNLAKILRKKRMKNGAITFDKVEVKFTLDKDNEPTGIRFKHSKDAHKLIEEFMLLANRKVAEFIGQSKDGSPSGRTFVYRVHDLPDMDKLIELQHIISRFGYSIDLKDAGSLSKSINKLLEEVKGTPEENMIETLTIRSMSKAIYTTRNIGHYGLAFEYYTHFTSPIRRYPDVMVHRLLQHYLDKRKSPQRAPYEAQCKHSSEREQLATKAERDSIKYMQVKYMMKHMDEEFEGVISGITSWGVFVEIIDNLCEGMVRIRDIMDDYFLFEEKEYAIIGQSTGMKYRLGDKVIIRVKHADLEKKQLDFTLLGHVE